MHTSYKTLFEAIRAKCEQEHWFGPELLSPKHRTETREDDPACSGFLFPPASEELLQASEMQLGFPLPPLLRALYATVANGGFGPGTGIRGVLDGYGKRGTGWYPDDDGTVVARYKWESRDGTLEPAENEAQSEPINMSISDEMWPKGLLPIDDLGCVQEAYVDRNERMYLVAPTDENTTYYLHQMPWSLEEWLWRWVKDETYVD